MPNVFRMKLLGAEVVPAKSGSRTLKDALNEALRDWVANVEDTFYCIGTVAGPHPYPEMVRDFQCVIGDETKKQMLHQEGRLPDSLVADSNAMGLFHPFLDDKDVAIFGVEAAGLGLETKTKHAASITGGKPGVLHGNRTYLLMDDDGARLSRHRTGACLAQRHRPRAIRFRHRQGSARCLPALFETRRHHSRPRAFARP